MAVCWLAKLSASHVARANTKKYAPKNNILARALFRRRRGSRRQRLARYSSNRLPPIDIQRTSFLKDLGSFPGAKAELAAEIRGRGRESRFLLRIRRDLGRRSNSHGSAAAKGTTESPFLCPSRHLRISHTDATGALRHGCTHRQNIAGRRLKIVAPAQRKTTDGIKLRSRN